jgi:hypothetical protein
MPIRKDDVLAVLSDPLLNQMLFSVGAITVSGNEYANLADYIKDGDIQVSPGTEAMAFYDAHANTIITQAGNPPLNLADRAQLLHECTHAVVDINELPVERLDNEVAAYLAQVTFMDISNPVPLPGPVHPPHRGSPLGELVWSLQQVIQKYNLHNHQGFGASLSHLDIWKLKLDVHALPQYAQVGMHEKSVSDGVPVKHNQMLALKAALRRAHRPRENSGTSSPAPRIQIF